MPSLLPTGTISASFDRIVAALNKLFAVQHQPDGSHGAVSLLSLDLAVLTPPSLTANTNNYAPTGLSAASYLRVSATGAVNVTGLSALTSYRLLWLRNVGANNITLTHEDANSAATNRFHLPNAANLVLGQYEGVCLIRDVLSGRWATFQQ